MVRFMFLHILSLTLRIAADPPNGYRNFKGLSYGWPEGYDLSATATSM